MRKKVLFITHTKEQCGVYQFGKDIFDAISTSSKYDFIKVECESLAELKKEISFNKPAAIIYNYHPDVMTWVCTKNSKGIYINNIVDIPCQQIGIIHEITQEVADGATAYRNKVIVGDGKKLLNSLFDFYVAADPTLLLKNPFVFKTGRLIPTYNSNNVTGNYNVPIIGSFGFATANKGFEELVKTVQREFDEALIRINMPSAYFGDREGNNAKKIAENCKSLITKKGIKLEITHEFLEGEKVLDFLDGNDLNAFFYEDKNGRGISSAVDNALAVKKPIAISNCPMFRHILNTNPSICIEKLTLKEILKNGFEPLEKFIVEWDSKNMQWEYERILDTVFLKSENIIIKKVGLINKFKNVFRKKLSLPDSSFSWLRDTESATKDNLEFDNSLKYLPIQPEKGDLKLNRILDDTARELYKSAIDLLLRALPKTMEKKIVRANVQQGFVFDTVYRSLKNYTNPTLLCVGSYEDTASLALIKMGVKVEEIDPMINYFLQDFYTKPTTKKGSYNIIFSTSVIEHDPDDKSFLECIDGLLAPGGIGIITCDYQDGWVEGMPKPDVDARFYTKKDMEERMLSYMPNCILVDKGDWECPNPDFILADKYRYTFATFVFRKK